MNGKSNFKDIDRIKKDELYKLESFLHDCLILREKSYHVEKEKFNQSLGKLIQKNKSLFKKYSLAIFYNEDAELVFLNRTITIIEKKINNANEFLDKRYKASFIKNEEKRNRNIERFTKVLAIGVLVQILNYTFNIVYTLNEKKTLVILGLSIISIVMYILLLIVALRIMNEEGKLLKEFNHNKLVKYTIYLGLGLILLQLIYEIFSILLNLGIMILNIF